MWKAEEIDPAEPPAEVAGEEYQEALEIMAAWTKSERARDLYRRRMEYQWTMNSIKGEARRAGLAEGRQEGRAEGERETAKRFKELGVDLDVIVRATGLSREEVERL